MKNRIKEIRKEHNLTQTEFGEKIGVKGNTVTGYETGLRTPTNAVITSICREFNVNEKWLKDGIGEKFIPRSKDEEIAIMLSTIQNLGNNSFKKRLITALVKLDDKGWEKLEELIENISKKD